VTEAQAFRGSRIEEAHDAAFGIFSMLKVTFSANGRPSGSPVDTFAASGIREIVIPPSITTIGREAFADCRSLAVVQIDSSVLATIGTGAFQNTSVNYVAVPWPVSQMESTAFVAPPMLRAIDDYNPV
jgi:hypothetical protein